MNEKNVDIHMRKKPMNKKLQKTIKELYRRGKEIANLRACHSLIEWDERTYMPPKGADQRADMNSQLAGLIHDKFTDPKIDELISELERSRSLGDAESVDAVNIREFRHDYNRATKVPKRLVEELARVTSLGQGVWTRGRHSGDFAEFYPLLEQILKLRKEQADAWGYKKDPYDALLEDYEPGATIAEISRVFDGFRPELVDFVHAIIESGRKPNVALLARSYPTERQEMFGEMVSTAIGFDYTAGRLDVTTHPFCTSFGPGDTRITTHYDPNNFAKAFFGIIHEAGHGIYDQGLPVEHWGTPMGEFVSLGIHESQSRMWENMVARSKPFWDNFLPIAKCFFPEALTGVKVEDFYFAVNDVRPSLIRIEADEVTYNLHIMLRFEMERAFFSGDMKVRDIPGAWNEKFKAYFGITPSNDAEGCFQDVHWSAGYIGYFPTYALGNLYAAQFYTAAEKELGNLHDMFSRGEFLPLKNWLNEKIHSQGKRYRAAKLCEVITGKPLSHKPMMKYMKEKYSPLYGL